jgi:hypothetical protein
VADPLSRLPEQQIPTTKLVLNAITMTALAVQTRQRSQGLTPVTAPVTNKKQRKRKTSSEGPGTPLGAPLQGVPLPVQGGSPNGLPTGSPQEPATGGSDLMRQLQEGYALDAWFSNPNNLKDLTQHDGLWWSARKVVVPDIPGLRRGILAELHDAPYSGHPGVHKLIEAVLRLYWWQGVRNDVKHYVQTCTSCQRNKPSNQHPAGLLQSLPIPAQPWYSVSMDFIVQLPPAAGGQDAIIVFVDRLTKMVHLAATTTTVSAEGTAQLFMDTVFKLHGVPKYIISDRGSTFVGQFMTELLRLIGTQHKRSTAYHPQSDGQTERVNRVLEEMLRHYVGGTRHGDWVNCLAAAEFAINNSHHESVGTSPFRLNYGRDPRLPITVLPGSKVPSAAAFADRMERGLADAKLCLQAAQHRQKVYYDRTHRDVTFQEGEQVLLSTKNIRLRRTGDKSSTPKLMPRFIGPFSITHVVGKGAYALKLPSHMKIHPVFHVSLLRPYHHDVERVQPPPDPIELEDGPEYFVQGIRNHRGPLRRREFLVQWTGYGPEHDSWEPEREIGKTKAYELYIQQKHLIPQGLNVQEE